MSPRRTVALIALVLCCTAPTPVGAVEEPLDTGANLGDDISAHIRQRSPGEPGGGPHGSRPFHYETDYVSTGIGTCVDGVREVVYRVWDDGSGRRELVYAGCPRVSTPGRPTPPSAAEVRDAVGIPDPAIATSPGAKTLAGMRTDYWYTGPTERTVSVELNGFAVVATAHATSYRWQFGDGEERTTTVPGSESAPATSHAYRDRGTKTITLTVTWTGRFTFAGPAGITGGGDLGSQAFTSSRPIVVQEIQPVGQRAP